MEQSVLAPMRLTRAQFNNFVDDTQKIIRVRMPTASPIQVASMTNTTVATAAAVTNGMPGDPKHVANLASEGLSTAWHGTPLQSLTVQLASKTNDTPGMAKIAFDHNQALAQLVGERYHSVDSPFLNSIRDASAPAIQGPETSPLMLTLYRDSDREIVAGSVKTINELAEKAGMTLHADGQGMAHERAEPKQRTGRSFAPLKQKLNTANIGTADRDDNGHKDPAVKLGGPRVPSANQPQ